MTRWLQQTKKFLGFTLSVALLLTMLWIPSLEVHAEESGVGGFVNRCYQVALGRDADPDGYADWTGKLTNGEMDGATVAWGFVFSPEYTKLNKDNGAFVTDMYTLFLGRTPDEAGFNDWKGRLDAGANRQEIFYGFANSVEFFDICLDYGVTAGYYTTEFNKDQVNAVNMFVARMYRICLNRLGDQGGQADWTSKLLRGELTGNDCAHGFIFSQEYTGLGLSNEDYVKNLYRTFMGRESDPDGFTDWTSKLNSGYTRDEVFSGFANSSEFQSICDSYGIIRGDYTAADVHEANGGGEKTNVEEHGWRIAKKTYSNGQYSLYSYISGYAMPKIVRYSAEGIELGVEQSNEYDENSKQGTHVSAYYDEDGSLSNYERSVYTYVSENTDELVERDTVYDQAGTITGYKDVVQQNIYGTGDFYTVEEKDYDANNNLESIWKYNYGPKGKYTSYAWYRADGTLHSISTYDLDNEGKVHGGSTIYYKEDGVTVDSSYKTVVEFGADGNAVKENLSYNDELAAYTLYIRENGKLTRSEFHQADGTLSMVTEYQYDAYGNVVKEARTDYYDGEPKVYWEVLEYEQY
ncbi:MAG: DUF4214 domain-containing protein [Lachnospiraceae bacterium]|nr:DUF4214 domain-containing protein [Lachnospiraceae bacterium]